MTNSHKVQFVPCGHCFCVYCSNRLITENVDLNCPICRGSVKDTVLLPCTIKPEDYLLIIEDGIFD